MADGGGLQQGAVSMVRFKQRTTWSVEATPGRTNKRRKYTKTKQPRGNRTRLEQTGKQYTNIPCARFT